MANTLQRPTEKLLRTFTNWEVLQGWVAEANVSYAHLFKDEMRARIADGRVTAIMLNSTTATAGHPPLPHEPSTRALTLDGSTSLTELATEMMDSGWHCEGMRDPPTAYDWLVLAASRDEVMDDLPPQGQDFWRAALTKWQLWKIRVARGAQS